jgi:hypothetical protein
MPKNPTYPNEVTLRWTPIQCLTGPSMGRTGLSVKLIVIINVIE